MILVISVWPKKVLLSIWIQLSGCSFDSFCADPMKESKMKKMVVIRME